MKGDITASSVANSVRMKRTQCPQTFVIVEGGSDKRAYEVFTDPKSCKIEIAHGKSNLLAAVETLRKDGVLGILGLADADFDRIIGTPSVKDVVLTDLHDLECMMIVSGAFAKLIYEFGNQEKIDVFVGSGSPLFERLSLEAEKIGILRLASIANNLELRFEGLKFHKFVNQATMVIDEGKLLDSVFNLSPNATVAKDGVGQIVAKLRANRNLERWQVICGHDFVELLTIGFRKALGAEKSIAVSTEALERALRLAYPRETFFQSNMLTLIKAWEVDNSPYIVLDRQNGLPTPSVE